VPAILTRHGIPVHHYAPTVLAPATAVGTEAFANLLVPVLLNRFMIARILPPPIKWTHHYAPPATVYGTDVFLNNTVTYSTDTEIVEKIVPTIWTRVHAPLATADGTEAIANLVVCG
jgi:hypothetical protein